MKIIKEGRLPDPVSPVLTGACMKCSCMVECGPDDPNILQWSRNDGSFYANCPTKYCGGAIKLKAKKI